MCSGSFRPLGLPIYVAAFQHAPFASRAFRFAVVIRCLLRPSNELRRAMEMLNRYIDGERKTRSDDGFAWYRDFVTRNTVSSRMESLTAGRIAGDTPAATAADFMHRKRLTIHAGNAAVRRDRSRFKQITSTNVG